MRKILFINMKGGVGKSSNAITISHMLSLKNKKVLLIDLDPQGNTTSMYSEVDVMEQLSAALQGQALEKELSLENLFLDSKLDIHKVIKKTQYPNLDIIPSFLTLATVESQMKNDVTNILQFRLKNHIKKIEDEYDFLIIDCSPSLSIVNVNGLALPEVEVYIPMRADAWSGIGMTIARQAIDDVRDYNPSIQYKGCFFTQWEEKSVNKTVLEIYEKIIPQELIPVRIRKSKLIEEMSYMQKPLMAYIKEEKIRKRDYEKIVDDYEKLIEFILGN